MIRLDTVNRSLTLFLGGAQVTAPLQIVVSYSDQTSSTYLGSTNFDFGPTLQAYLRAGRLDFDAVFDEAMRHAEQIPVKC